MTEKKRTNRIYIIVILVLVMIAGYAAARLMQVDLPEDPVRVSVILENSSSERWGSYRSGIEQAAEDFDVELSTVTTSYYSSDEQEAELIASEQRLGADGVVTAPDPDADAVTALLVSAVESDFDGDLSGRTVAILAGSPYDGYATQILTKLTESLEEQGAEIFWSESLPYNVARLLKHSKRMDIVIALDDDSLSAAAAYLTKKSGSRRLYGIGCSPTCVYYLDRGVISAMVACDDFTAGYETLEAVAKGWDAARIVAVPRLILPDEVYDEENEKLLFP